MEVRNTNFAAFIDVFTSNTYVMVVVSDPTIRKYFLILLKVIVHRFILATYFSSLFVFEFF